MKANRKLSVVVLFLAIILQVNTIMAQLTNKDLSQNFSYSSAIGLRVGETSGLTIKHFINGSSHAVEVIVGASPYSVGITGLYEKYVSTGVKGLNWYFGGGAHANMNSPRRVYYYNENRYYYYRNYPGIGIDGILGIEYKLAKIPFAISLDAKPFLEINNSPNIFLALDPGLGIKYTF